MQNIVYTQNTVLNLNYKTYIKTNLEYVDND